MLKVPQRRRFRWPDPSSGPEMSTPSANAQRAPAPKTWSRQDIERLFGISRASAQNLMKAIGEVQAVGGTHFVDRASLLGFLDQMVTAESVDEELRSRHERAEPVPPADYPSAHLAGRPTSRYPQRPPCQSESQSG